MNYCLFCGWIGDQLVCPRCDEYKGIVPKDSDEAREAMAHEYMRELDADREVTLTAAQVALLDDILYAEIDSMSAKRNPDSAPYPEIRALRKKLYDYCTVNGIRERKEREHDSSTRRLGSGSRTGQAGTSQGGSGK